MEDFFAWVFIVGFIQFIILGVSFRVIESEEGSEKKGAHDGTAFKYTLVIAIVVASIIVNNK